MQLDHGSTRRRMLKGVAALPAAALGGCVVTPYGPYYRPSADHPAAAYKGAWCNGVAGPKSVIEIPLAPGVLLTARAQREYVERDRAELPLRLTLTLLPTAPARFAGSELRVVEQGSGRTLAGTPKIRAFRYATLDADPWIDPARVRPSGAIGTPLDSTAPHGTASVRVTLPGFAPERIAVDGLVVQRDGATVALPLLEMRRPASRGSPRDYRSATLDARLRERVAACKRDTPQRACDNIADYSRFSFEEATPAVGWKGRFYVFDACAGAQLEGDIEASLRTAGRWRLASGMLTVRDLDAGISRSALADKIHLALNDWIALDTPLFAGPVDGSGEARLSIELLLPGSAPDFDLVLPALLLGGQRIDVPRIRFDRRTFDGGVEPFNC
jgi:hypothetical protein